MNEFLRSQTAEVIKNRNIQGEQAILNVAEDVGVQIRLTIERIGGTMPEDMYAKCVHIGEYRDGVCQILGITRGSGARFIAPSY